MISSCGGIVGEAERQRRASQPREMLAQAEDAASIEAQPFPDRVAALHDRIERRDAGSPIGDAGRRSTQ